ncbi:MAG: hypothetical protein AAF997_23500 [Myxococcota bacterium]
MRRVTHWGPRIGMLLLASCAPVQSGTTPVESKRHHRHHKEDTSAQLAGSVVSFSTAVAEAMKDEEASALPNNTYSHQRVLGRRKRFGEPRVELMVDDDIPLLSSTDCSGLLSFVLNTVSPLHEAVLQSQRRLAEHNKAYSEDFTLRERLRPWPRAFVVTQFLRADYADETGFQSISDFRNLKAGDIGAYAMGRYAKPADETRPRPRDTGHVFVVVGEPSVVPSDTKGYDGDGTLSKDTATVIAIPVIDSSATVHFDPDSRKNEKGRYTLPKTPPHPRARPGGVGTGTIWFALNSEGRVLQRRLGPAQKYRAVLARAARLNGNIELEGTVLDEGDSLVVRVFDSAPSEFRGVTYGDAPVHLTGKGGLRLASGRLVLDGVNDFTGGVTIDAAELIVASPTALGSGAVSVRGGSMKLEKPAIARTASLSLAAELPDGAVQLDFKGKNVLQALRIGDETHRCGTWGGPDSKAMFIDPVFSGQGVLELAGQPIEACTPSREEAPERRRRARKSSKLRASAY